MRVTVTRRLPGADAGRLGEWFDEVAVIEEGRPLTRQELKEALRETDVVICSLTDRIDSETLGVGVKCVITYSVGIDHIHLPALAGKGIKLSHTPAVLTDATADLAWAALLACAREIAPAERFVREGRFNGFGPELFLGKRVAGARLGIVGMGRIGQAVARRARGFGMETIYHSRRGLPEAVERELGARRVGLAELLATSDFVSLHCPLTAETRHLVGAEALVSMKEDACLVNTARGALVDEAALVRHLAARPSFRAALDVYESEPKLADGLAAQPNALLLPHIGSADRATREEMTRIVIEEAIRFAKGEPLRYEVQG